MPWHSLGRKAGNGLCARERCFSKIIDDIESQHKIPQSTLTSGYILLNRPCKSYYYTVQQRNRRANFRIAYLLASSDQVSSLHYALHN